MVKMQHFECCHGGSIPSSRTGERMNIPVDVRHYLGEHFYSREVNVILNLRGHTLFYIAIWETRNKKHRLKCIDELLPDKPTLRLVTKVTNASNLYFVQGTHV